MQPSYAPPPPPGPPPSPIPPWARWLGLGCGALMLLGMLGSVLFFTVLKRATAGPEQVVQSFLTSAAAGDFASAHGHFSAALKEAQSLEVFSAAAGAHQELFQVSDTTFSDRSVDLMKARLAGTVTLTDGRQLPAQFELIREGSQWKLTLYNIGTGG